MNYLELLNEELQYIQEQQKEYVITSGDVSVAEAKKLATKKNIEEFIYFTIKKSHDKLGNLSSMKVKKSKYTFDGKKWNKLDLLNYDNEGRYTKRNF